MKSLPEVALFVACNDVLKLKNVIIAVIMNPIMLFLIAKKMI